MAGLKDTTVATGYKSLLRVDDNSNGIEGVSEFITDGEGTVSCMKMGTRQLAIQSQASDSSDTFTVHLNDGSYIIRADTDNGVVKIGTGQNIANTQYAHFGVGNTDSASFAVNTHQARRRRYRLFCRK
jgi:hypothetical protein